MFRIIELLGIAILLWFIANFVRYIAYTLTGMGNDAKGGLFTLSDNWINKELSNKDKIQEFKTKKRKEL